MSYMLFIVEPRGQRAERTEAEGRALYQRMLDYAEDLKVRGVLRAYSSLRNDAEGQRLQIRAGKRRRNRSLPDVLPRRCAALYRRGHLTDDGGARWQIDRGTSGVQPRNGGS